MSDNQIVFFIYTQNVLGRGSQHASLSTISPSKLDCIFSCRHRNRFTGEIKRLQPEHRLFYVYACCCTAAKAKSVDGKVTLEKTTLAQVHSAYKGEKNSTWCQSGKGLVAPNKAVHYCSTFGVPDRKAKVSAIVYNPKMIGRTITVKEVKKAYSTAKLDKTFNLMTVSTKEVNIYLNLNSDRTQVMSILVKYN